SAIRPDHRRAQRSYANLLRSHRPPYGTAGGNVRTPRVCWKTPTGCIRERGRVTGWPNCARTTWTGPARANLGRLISAAEAYPVRIEGSIRQHLPGSTAGRGVTPGLCFASTFSQKRNSVTRRTVQTSRATRNHTRRVVQAVGQPRVLAESQFR